MFRFSNIRRGVALLLAVGLIGWSGCKTQRVYEDTPPKWMQQATGQVDLSTGFGPLSEWQKEEREEERNQDPSRQREQRQAEQSEPEEAAPHIQVGPPRITTSVEGQDY